MSDAATVLVDIKLDGLVRSQLEVLLARTTRDSRKMKSNLAREEAAAADARERHTSMTPHQYDSLGWSHRVVTHSERQVARLEEALRKLDAKDELLLK